MPEYKEDSRVVRRKQPEQKQRQQQADQTQDYSTITTVETASGSSLSTSSVMYLAGLSPDHKLLARMARLYALNYDLRPDQVFGTTDPKELSKRYGEKLDMKDMQRLTDNFSPVAITHMLQATITNAQSVDATQKSTRLARSEQPGDQPTIAGIKPDAKKIGQWGAVIANTLENPDITRGMGLAVAMSGQGLDPKTFYNNFQQVKRWWAATSSEPFDEDTAMEITMRLGNKKANGITDVSRLLVGKQQVKAEHKVAVTDAAYAQSQAYYDYDTGKIVQPDVSEQQALYHEALKHQAAAGDPFALAANTDIGPNFWKQVNDIQAQIQMQDEMFSNSPLGKAFKFVGWVGNKSWEATEKGLVHLGADIMSGAQFAENLALSGKGITGAENGYKFWQDKKQEALHRLNQGDSVGDLVEEGYGEKGLGVPLPAWTSTAFDFGVGWYVDPFVVGGKAVRILRGVDPIIGGRRLLEDGVRVLDQEGNQVYRATRLFGKDLVIPGRVLPHLDESFKLTENILSYLPNGKSVVLNRRAAIDASLQAGFAHYVKDVLPTSRVADKIWDGLKSGNMDYFRQLDLRTPGTFVGRTLDYEYMKLVRSRIMEVYGDGGKIPASVEKEAREAFGDALRAHFVGYGPKGSVAEWAVTKRSGLSRDALDKALVSGAEETSTDLQNAISEYLAEGGDSGNHLPFTLEGPGRSGIYGPRRAYRQAVTSEAVTQYGIGRRFAGLRNVNPGRVLDVAAGDEYVLLHARRWATFDERTVRRFQSMVNEAKAKGFWHFDVEGHTISMGYEEGLSKFVEDINTEALNKVLDDLNVDGELRAELHRVAFDNVRSQNTRTQSFLAGEEGSLRAKPVLETQLKNQFYVVDPVEVRRIVREYVQAPQRAKQILWKALKKEAPAITEQIPRNILTAGAAETAKFAHNVNRARIKLWKALTVARPGYIPRVILGDENARFLVTTRSITERLAAQEWFGLTRKISDVGAEELALRGGASRNLFHTTITYPDGTIVNLPAIGSIDNNLRATGSIRRAEQTEDILRSADKDLSSLNTSGSWAPVAASRRAGMSESVEIIGKTKFVKRWRWALEKQFAKSAPGQVALEAVAAGKTVEETRAALVQWAKDDHFVTLRARLGYQPAEWDAWFNDVSASAHAYTNGSKEIANAALTTGGKELDAILNKWDPAKMPVVHGSSVEAMLQGQAAASGFNLANTMYKYTVSQPEAILNRNPFYKVWKQRAEKAYHEHLAANGVTLTPEIRNALDTASTEFALEQVRAVMFDLTRQSRVTELLQIAFPFPQPFFEGFQTWGSIAVRNPEGIGRIMQVFRTGVESGVIKKDPQTNEYVIPMGAFRWFAAPWAVLHGEDPKEALHRMDQLGIGFVGPLTSFNMLAASSIKFSEDTPIIGKIAGGVPFPMPGLDPLYAMAAQYYFKDTQSLPITSYLFQYGPATPINLLPNTIKAALGLIPDEQKSALAASILRTYQVQHLTDDNGKPIPPDELAAMASHDAEEMLHIRQFAQMFSPGALRTTTAAGPYEAEWQALLETSTSYDVALATWTQKHPDLSYIPIGKTFFADGRITDPKTGAYIQMPRVPSSDFFGRMWDSPGAGEFARSHPEWAGLFLIGLDPSVTEKQDFPTYSKMLRDGMLKYRPLTDTIRQGENLKVRNSIDLWYRTVWDPKMDQLLDGRTQPDYTSAAYKNLIADRRDFLSILAQQNPTWAMYNLENVGTYGGDTQRDREAVPHGSFRPSFEGNNDIHDAGETMWDWPSDSGPDRPYRLAIDQARDSILGTPGTEHLPGFMALDRAFQVYDKAEQAMAAKGYTDIFQTGALEDKIPDKLAKGLTEVYADTPEIQPYIEAAFGIRLQEGTLEAAPSLQNLPSDWREDVASLGSERRDQVEKWGTHYKVLRDLAKSDYEFDWQRNQRYQAATNFADEQFLNNPSSVKDWWNHYMTKTDRASYVADLASKPTVFYSVWDWHTLGVKVGAKTSGYMQQIADRRIQISRKELEDPEGFSQGDAYAALNADIRQWSRKDKNLGNLVEIMNDPSWVLYNVPGYVNQVGGPKSGPQEAKGSTDKHVDYTPVGKSEAAWSALAQTVDGIVKSNAANGLTGVKDFDKGQSNWYAWVQRSVSDYVEELRKYSGSFGEQYDALKEQLGGSPVTNLFIPDSYYPLGGDE